MNAVTPVRYDAGNLPREFTVPREFLGMARVFRSRVDEASAGAVKDIVAIGAEAVATWRRRRDALRPEHAISLAARWRNINPVGRLACEVVTRKRHLELVDVRCTGATLEHDTYDSDLEPGISIVATRLTVTAKERPVFTIDSIVTMSLHALGRRFQRSARDDFADADIERDLVVLARCAWRRLTTPWPLYQDEGDDTPAKEAFTCVTTLGQWRGFYAFMAVGNQEGVRAAAHCRTYLEARALEAHD